LRLPRRLIALPQHDEPVRVGVVEGPKQHAIDEREDRGVDADGQRQRQHDDEREARLAGEGSYGFSDVGSHFENNVARR
jgi:hypothetical protein